MDDMGAVCRHILQGAWYSGDIGLAGRDLAASGRPSTVTLVPPSITVSKAWTRFLSRA